MFVAVAVVQNPKLWLTYPSTPLNLARRYVGSSLILLSLSPCVSISSTPPLSNIDYYLQGFQLEQLIRNCKVSQLTPPPPPPIPPLL